MKGLPIVVGLLGLAALFSLLQTTFPRVPFETIAIGEESGLSSQEALAVNDPGLDLPFEPSP